MNLRLSLYGVGTWHLHRSSPYERGYPVYQSAFICPVCLHKWAEIAIENQPTWEIRCVNCPRHPTPVHPDINPVPGSLLDNSTVGGYDGGLLDILPESLIIREFHLHLTAYEAICQPPSQVSSPESMSFSKVPPEPARLTPLLPSLNLG